jgi:hypothetical protein
MAIKKLAGPTFLALAAANVYNLNDALIKTLVTQIHIANVTGGSVAYSLYVGLTGASLAGTELAKSETILGNGHIDLYFSPALPLLSTDFLTGSAGSASALAITVIGEQEVI